MYQISKILLNYFFVRSVLNPALSDHHILSSETLNKQIEKFGKDSIEDILDLDNDNFLVSFKNKIKSATIN